MVYSKTNRYKTSFTTRCHPNTNRPETPLDGNRRERERERESASRHEGNLAFNLIDMGDSTDINHINHFLYCLVSKGITKDVFVTNTSLKC